MSLADRLAALGADDQGALARRQAAEASAAELIEALRVPGLGEWARLHIVHELTHRGPSLVEPIGRGLRERPLAPNIGAMTEALVQLFESEPAMREPIARALIEAGNAALDAGGDTFNAGLYVAQLEECAKLDAPLPEVAQLARRLLAVAATEPQPYAVTVLAAKRIAASGS